MKTLTIVASLLLSTYSLANANNLLIEDLKIKDTTFIGYADTHSDFGHTMALNKASKSASKKIKTSCNKINSKRDCSNRNLEKVSKKMTSMYSTDCGGSLFQGCYFSAGYIIKKKIKDNLVKNIIIKKELIDYSQERKCNSHSTFNGKKRAEVLLTFTYKATFVAVLNPVITDNIDENRTIDDNGFGYYSGPYISGYESKIDDSQVEILMKSHRFGYVEREESINISNEDMCKLAFEKAYKSVRDAATYEESQGDLHKYITFE
jgi:hypothetical protein